MIPDTVGDIRYSILDCSDPKHIDFYYLPLVFLESFSSPAAVLTIGETVVQVPLDWSIMICDEEMNELEILPVASLNDRGFHALTYNPYSSSYPTSGEINLVNIYSDIKWYFPKLKTSTMLLVPLDNSPEPRCIYLVKDLNKVPNIEIGDLV